MKLLTQTNKDMNNKELNPVVIPKKDYQILRSLVERNSIDAHCASLASELERAILVNDDAFPPHAIKLNSKVSVMDLETSIQKTFWIVMPQLADIAQQKISILSPMGTALLGFRKGEEVQWAMPKGLKQFKIMEVWNE